MPNRLQQLRKVIPQQLFQYELVILVLRLSILILHIGVRILLGAAAKLKSRKGKNGSHMGFLRQRPDGTTSLNIITGEAGVIPGTEKDRPVLLGSLLGKVKQGTGSIQV